ncbi:right-handed parallel beta-helix repeat-containing protein [Dyadobacter arcticus]|uniref:Right handed beta helix region n=1 Tax=Dyadobacter arcticus TaxID=1078754 RepID=A0ABX0USR4_9BACT|nr:right-handed parallel beta-helix repeat-containing protein [Dyadobacter arcticus]NIJ54969.1 hypothetical protein [Dyadobacter arcticus]
MIKLVGILLFSLIFPFADADQVPAKHFDFFVSGEGNDTYKGTLEQPLRSLTKAIDLVGPLPANSSTTIHLRGGTYRLLKGVKISKETLENGKHLLLTNYNNEEVFLSGGIKLESSSSSLVTNKNVLRRLPEKSRGNVYELDLGPYSSSDITLHKNGFGQPRTASAIELFVNSNPARLARWPKDSSIKIATVLPAAQATGEDQASFTINNSQATKWKSIPDVWIAGSLSRNWAYDNLPVSRFDAKDSSLGLSDKGKYMIKPASTKERQRFGDSKMLGSFFFYNVFEELSLDREWVVDPKSKKIYVYLNSKADLSTCELSILKEPIISINDAENIQIKGINFRLGRSSAIKVSGTNNILIENCTFKNFGLLGIDGSGCKKFEIIGCKIENTGSGGIALSGGNRKTLDASANAVKNCAVTNFSRLYRSYSPAITIKGVGIKIQNNDISEAPGQAIIFHGNDHVISYNRITNVCQEFGDLGAVYTGRDPSATGTMIANNIFKRVTNKVSPLVAAIYVDDGSGGFTISNNLFVNSGSSYSSGFGAVHINGGSDSRFTSNAFIDCRRAFSYNPWSDKKWQQTFLENKDIVGKLTKTVDIRSDLYTKKYPHLTDFFEPNSKKRVNYVSGNYFLNVNAISSGSGYIVEGSISQTSNQGNKATLAKDARKADIPDEVRQWKGWEQVEFDKIGAKFVEN